MGLFYAKNGERRKKRYNTIKYQIIMIKKYVEENKDRMLEELFSLIRIPSVSAQPAHKEDMVRCAEHWKELLLEAGVDKAEVW